MAQGLGESYPLKAMIDEDFMHFINAMMSKAQVTYTLIEWLVVICRGNTNVHLLEELLHFAWFGTYG